MIRISEIKLPLQQAQTLTHAPEILQAAIIKKLGIQPSDLIDFSIYKRGVDARRKNAILFVYIQDLQ